MQVILLQEPVMQVISCFPCCYIHATSPVVVSLVTMRVTSSVSQLNNSLVSDHDLDLAVMAVHAQ